ncbi:MAG TPA: FHA domain-containing protein [Promineifilum sp.]|nr:FHA domain-containing protein [Promineifilum sp.]
MVRSITPARSFAICAARPSMPRRERTSPPGGRRSLARPSSNRQPPAESVILPAAPAPAMPPRALHIRLPHHDATLILTGALIQVGRADPGSVHADPGSVHAPELDLTTYGGQERGVSRRHATIQWVEGSYVLIDQHSSNGTWLNDVRLVPGYAYQIPPGAKVRFGGLLVQLTIAD